MNIGQELENRKRFVEDQIAPILAVKRDFDYIKYARTKLTDSEYIRIGDILGRAITLNITALSLEEIVEEIARVILVQTEKINPPKSVVLGADELRAIAPLFTR